MTALLIYGDHVSCSRVGGVMRLESSRLRQHTKLLEEAFREIAPWEGQDTDAARGAFAVTIQTLRATADDLDKAGATLQCFATDLAEGHELGRRAELRVHGAGLLLDGTRVIEPWGPASAQEAERRRAQMPEVQARVDLATSLVGRARGRLGREMTRLAQDFSGHSRAAQLAPRFAVLPPR